MVGFGEQQRGSRGGGWWWGWAGRGVSITPPPMRQLDRAGLIEKGRAGRSSTKPITHCLQLVPRRFPREVGRPGAATVGGETDAKRAPQPLPLLSAGSFGIAEALHLDAAFTVATALKRQDLP